MSTGLSTIYEMVINNNPSYAYLLEGNEMVTQKMVMAHVTGHVDFFKNNMWFSHTNRNMLDDMANHAARIQRMHRPLWATRWSRTSSTSACRSIT